MCAQKHDSLAFTIHAYSHEIDSPIYHTDTIISVNLNNLDDTTKKTRVWITMQFGDGSPKYNKVPHTAKMHTPNMNKLLSKSSFFPHAQVRLTCAPYMCRYRCSWEGGVWWCVCGGRVCVIND